jgi:hypothetical protein
MGPLTLRAHLTAGCCQQQHFDLQDTLTTTHVLYSI